MSRTWHARPPEPVDRETWLANSATSPVIEETDTARDVVQVTLRRVDNRPMGKGLRITPEMWVGGNAWAPLMTLGVLIFPAREVEATFMLKVVAIARWRLRVYPKLPRDLAMVVR